ncbi:MAG: DNA polymerase I [Clostridiales bacterium]|nr:DNA polymerase I [Clostridiales bacterium]
MSNKRLIAIDGNSLINRAYYALPPLSTKSGLYTNAVYGFINMLNKVMDEYDPEYMAVAFDLKAPTFRHLEYSEYKAGRRKTPYELLQQFPLIKNVLRAMDIKIIELEGFEADDLIGTAVKRGEEAGLEPYVITGDKDALQLASDKTKIIITKKGTTDFDLYDEEKMMERYHLTPQQFIDLKGLMGDTSDNIPGIPGIGEKTGIALLEQFGTVENLLKNTDQISKPKLREKVEENAQLAVMSRRLAEINTNVPFEMDFEEFRIENPNKDEIIKLYREMELFSLITKLDKTWIGKNSTAEPGSEEEVSETMEKEETVLSEENIEIVYGLSEGFAEDLKKEESVYIKVFGDPNHIGTPEVFGVCAAVKNKMYYLTEKEDIIKAFEQMKEVNKGFKGHLLKDDYYMLMEILPEGYKYKTAFDTGIAQYIIEPQKNDFGYKALSVMYTGKDFEDEKAFYKNNSQTDLFGGGDKKYAEYGLKCIQLCKMIEPVQAKTIKDMGMEEVYYDIELPLIEIFADMENCGFSVDKDVLVDIGKTLDSELEGMKDRIYELAGEEFNINSPKQLGVILFEKLGMPGGKKTKTGYSTNVDVLEKLTEDYEIAGLVLQYRTLTKLKSTYVEGLLPLIDPRDGKIRAHFQQTGTATGRISCTEPNLQNIPVRQALGRTLRKVFIADEDCVLVDADYSQIELRVLAHISNDEGLIEAFRNGADIHTSTASKVFEVPENEVTPIQRSNAKAVNFGVIYGMSGFGLSENLNITRREAEKYIKDYFIKYSAVKAYLDKTIEHCREKGYVATIKGRRRDIVEIKASNFMQRQAGERLAMNSPIQGSAADIIKIAMIKVFNELREKGYKSKLILQVHDELIINTHKGEIEAVKELLRRNMMEAESLSVPLEVGMDSGDNWYDVK